jgi:hypothetical protein
MDMNECTTCGKPMPASITLHECDDCQQWNAEELNAWNPADDERLREMQGDGVYAR